MSGCLTQALSRRQGRRTFTPITFGMITIESLWYFGFTTARMKQIQKPNMCIVPIIKMTSPDRCLLLFCVYSILFNFLLQGVGQRSSLD